MDWSWTHSLGVALTRPEAPAHVAGWARAAEHAGLGSLWLIEDYFHPGAFALAGAAAAVTERATIGLGVVNPQLIQASPWRGLPPRLPGHPTFYPLLNEEYATQIARDWNANRDGGGYVTRFRVKAEFARWYEPQTVGAAVHKELWVPPKSSRSSTNTSLVKSKSSQSFMALRQLTRPANRPLERSGMNRRGECHPRWAGRSAALRYVAVRGCIGSDTIGWTGRGR